MNNKINELKEKSTNLIGGIISKRLFDEISEISPIGYQDNIEIDDKIIITTIFDQITYIGIIECTKIRENVYHLIGISNTYGLQRWELNLNHIDGFREIITDYNGKNLLEFMNLI